MKPFYPLFTLAAAFLLNIGLTQGEETEQAPPAEPVSYSVSPDGNDSAAGTAEAPFQTLTRARDQIRADKAAGKNGAWTVHIRGGLYPISEPIEFSNLDSGTPENPVRYIGEPDSQNDAPVFSGGTEITGWKDEGEYWSADLPVIDGTPIYFEQLFVNDHRGIRAREPNTGLLPVVSGKDENPKRPKGEESPKVTRQWLTVKEGALDFMKGTPQEELKYAQVVIHHLWDTTHRIILDYDTDTATLSLKGSPQPLHNQWRDTSYFEIYNLRSAFDVPGEWFYDGVNQKVLYRPLPGETIETTRFIVPRSGLVRILTVAGSETQEEGEDAPSMKPAHNITFENLSFSFSDSPRRKWMMEDAELDPEITGDLDKPGPSQFDPMQAAMFADSAAAVQHAEQIVLYKCNFTHIGEYALGLSDVCECRVERCDLRDLGAGGIRISGTCGKDESVFTRYNVINNNHIREGGRFHPAGVAIILANGTHDNEIMHNEVEDFFYTGISVGWTWGYSGGSVYRNRIEFNKIHKIGQKSLADMGGIYMLGTLHGTRVCNNVIYDVQSNLYGGWGIYTDEGSEGVTIENNLVYDTMDGSFHQHYGRGNLLRNNIFADSTPYQQCATRVEPHRSFTFEQNITYWHEGTTLGKKFGKVNALVRDNLWFSTAGSVDFDGKTHEEMEAEGFDVGGIVADPLFVDPENHDYRLRPDSPALKLGFVPFDYTKAGITPEE